MIFSILIIVLPIIVFVITLVKYDKWWGWFEAVLVSFLSAGATFALTVVLALIIGVFVPKHFEYTNIELYNLKDGSNIEGSFFLGSGRIDEKLVYTFYENVNGGAKLNNADADKAIVYQGNIDKPYAKRQTSCVSHWSWLTSCVSDKRITEFHVPENSIKQNFVLDAE